MKMSIRWRKMIPALAVLGLAFALSYVQIDDLDIWWHMKCGELFLRDFHVPRTEFFSYTAAGRPWVDGYLPAQVLFFIFWRLAGPAGVCLLGAALVTAIYGIAFLVSRRSEAGYGAALFAAIPAVFLARIVMIPRPALLSPIFALITMWLLEDHRLRGGRRIWWIIPITVLWTNCHPAFLFGPMITGIYFAGALPGWLRFSRPAPQHNTLAPLFCGQLAATLINPYSYKIYYSTLSLFSTPQLIEEISEWKPLFGFPRAAWGTLPCFFTVVAIWVAILIWGRFRIRLTHALLFLFITVSTIYARRNLIMFGPLSLPLIAWAVESSAGERSYAPLWKLRGPIVKAGAVMITAAGLFLSWFASTDRLYLYTNESRASGRGVFYAIFPQRAVNLLAKEKVKGNLYHTFGLGGYLIFNLYPGYRVFIDGRTYPYPHELFKMENESLYSSKVFNTLRERYDIRAVLLPTYPEIMWPAINAFIHSPDWAVVSAEDSGVLFLARGAGNDEIISRYQMDPLKETPFFNTPPAGRKFQLWDRAEFPYGPVRWAKFYEKIARPDLAAMSLKPAMNYRPVQNDIEALYGQVLIHAGNMEEGIEAIRRVLAKEPDNLEALAGLANYYLLTGEKDRAERIFLVVALKRPDEAKLWFLLGNLALDRMDYKTAEMRFRRAIILKPDQSRFWEGLGESLEHRDAAAAKDAYRRALDAAGKMGAPPEDIKRIQERLDKI